MKEFDYIIIGGGCSGLSLAYELEITDKLKDKTLAIVEPRDKYQKDKTWSFWKVFDHNFEDCVKKSWNHFSINLPKKTKYHDCTFAPYQTIDSGLFYEKILGTLKKNKNIQFFDNINEIETKNSTIFNSVPDFENTKEKLWQHFSGVEIETDKDFFDEEIFNLMDFDCEQDDSVHFFYTLPFSKKNALVESTWLSNLNHRSVDSYKAQLKDYIENRLNIKRYKVLFKEEGAIPLFHANNVKRLNQIDIGTAGGLTRLSTGYTFLNIQEHSKFIRKNLNNIHKLKANIISNKYQFLDKIFLKVLSNNQQKMPEVFYRMFSARNSSIINFLSNKSNIIEDIQIISKMPKWMFVKELF